VDRLKLRAQFEQTSRTVQVLPPGTRLHVAGTRRTADGAHGRSAAPRDDRARLLNPCHSQYPGGGVLPVCIAVIRVGTVRV